MQVWLCYRQQLSLLISHYKSLLLGILLYGPSSLA
uniref:Uncharacterized protein n=1 Tax=Tetraselmis sp. GSL018 TaxID=582737 RepID=A0A061QSK3_9CHLO